MLATAALGATFVGMQAFEWTKLIMEGVRPWENPFGAAQFGSSFFMITGFHGMHVTAGVIYLLVVAFRVRKDAVIRETAVATTRLSRSPASTGTSLTSSGYSFSHSSISGKGVRTVWHGDEGQQHPLKIYWIMWGALFVLSAFSYWTDFMGRRSAAHVR